MSISTAATSASSTRRALLFITIWIWPTYILPEVLIDGARIGGDRLVSDTPASNPQGRNALQLDDLAKLRHSNECEQERNKRRAEAASAAPSATPSPRSFGFFLPEVTARPVDVHRVGRPTPGTAVVVAAVGTGASTRTGPANGS